MSIFKDFDGKYYRDKYLTYKANPKGQCINYAFKAPKYKGLDFSLCARKNPSGKIEFVSKNNKTKSGSRIILTYQFTKGLRVSMGLPRASLEPIANKVLLRLGAVLLPEIWMQRPDVFQLSRLFKLKALQQAAKKYDPEYYEPSNFEMDDRSIDYNFSDYGFGTLSLNISRQMPLKMNEIMKEMMSVSYQGKTLYTHDSSAYGFRIENSFFEYFSVTLVLRYNRAGSGRDELQTMADGVKGIILPAIGKLAKPYKGGS